MQVINKKLRPGELTDDQVKELSKPGFFEYDGHYTGKNKASIDFFGNQIEVKTRYVFDGQIAFKARLRPDFVEYSAEKGGKVVEPPSYIYPKRMDEGIKGSVKGVDGSKPKPTKKTKPKLLAGGVEDLEDDADESFTDM